MTCHKAFLFVEGIEEGYPNYSEAKISLKLDDPSLFKSKNLYSCSPLFSFNKNGQELPILKKGTRITFFIVPQPFPNFGGLINEYKKDVNNKLWFSIGLCNLIVIEQDDYSLSSFVKDYLKKKKFYVGFEEWNLDDSNYIISSDSSPSLDFEYIKVGVELYDNLPNDIKFLVSEYIITSNKILTSCKRFTPQYFPLFTQIFKATSLLVKDLSFIHGDFNTDVSEDLIIKFSHVLSISSDEKDKLKIIQDKLKSVPENQIRSFLNQKLGRLIQITSACSYVYTQTFSGTFPLLDHVGIIRRHSLLGVGTAMNALMELILQLEWAFIHIPFERIDRKVSQKEGTEMDESKGYRDIEMDNEALLNSFHSDYHLPMTWEKDPTNLSFQKLNIRYQWEKEVSGDSDFYCRMPFFSGRLGFREYDLSVACALQSLVGCNTLKWNIINYTHEIIHGHVRFILNKLIRPFDNRYVLQQWIESNLNKLKEIKVDFFGSDNSMKKEAVKKIGSYYDFFVLIIFNYCVQSRYYGSLSREWDKARHNAWSDYLEGRDVNNKILPSTERIYGTPSVEQFFNDFRDHHYKDISEIFVHILDFNYTYQRKIDQYIPAIWASWITVPIVFTKLKEYVLRSLLIYGITLNENDPFKRFLKAVKNFQKTLSNPNIQSLKIPVVEINEYLGDIDNYLDDDDNLLGNSKPAKSDFMDLQQRFKNCIVIADMADKFFTSDLNYLLNDGDSKFNNKSILKDSDGNVIYYDLESLTFEDHIVKNKIGLAFDLLNRKLHFNSQSEIDDEYSSGWILLALSSYHHD